MVNFPSLCYPKNKKPLPIETVFNLPSPIPTWPPGEGFGSGTIDLGGLQVCQVSSFTKIWATHVGGPGNLGATFFEPSHIPEGFSMLGCYAQPNNTPLFGCVLVGKDVTQDPSPDALKKPIDYALVWSSESLKINQDNYGYIWLPIPPYGYKAVGHTVTNLPEKPSLDKIRCVQSDFTDICHKHTWIWGPKKKNNPKEFGIYSLRPTERGTKALGVPTGTFLAQNSGDSISLACLKNAKADFSSSMPNPDQVDALIEAYSPCIYFHPREKYLPSSVNWFFENGALLYKKGEESKPVPVESKGLNLPQGGFNDGAFWLDLPSNKAARELVKKGDLEEAEVYLRIKPMFGGTFTDIALWLFYPFNGPGKVKIWGIINIPLGKIGQHVGDWEHLTLRVSNFNGELKCVYFSQHSKGKWVNASELEFQNGNQFVAYASLQGHAFYPKPGVELQGRCGIGATNDSSRSKKVMDTAVRYWVVGGELFGVEFDEPPWLNYKREWGPKISYTCLGKFKGAFQKKVKFPKEVLGEEGPIGPKVKNSWSGDED